MKGLLVKDWKLLKNQRNSLLITAVIGAGLAAYMSNGSFIIGYLSFLGAQIARNTLSYDEFDNGYAFLFSLPVTRKGYVTEKYIFGLIVSGSAWLFGSAAAAVAGILKNTCALTDTLMIALMIFPLALIILSISLPFHFKFGAEKGSIAMIAAGGLLAMGFIVVSKIIEAVNLDLKALSGEISGINSGAAAAAGLAAGIIILLISGKISISIMEKKEF